MPYYAVARGRKQGVFMNWDACKLQVTGFPNAVFKKFPTAKEAHDFLVQHGARPPAPPQVENKADSKELPPRETLETKRLAVDSPPPAKRRAPSNTQSTDAKTSIKESQAPEKRQEIYVDGACRGNGKYAIPPLGYGVYFGPNDERNVGKSLSSVEDVKVHRPTNQRAELHALRHALRQILKEGETPSLAGYRYEIFTDSKYGKQCIDSWAPRWKANGWKTGGGKPVANKDLVEESFDLFNKINEKSAKVTITHVRGHQGIHGNEEADRLANLGCDLDMRGK